MRQPGKEFNIDPYKTTGTSTYPNPVIPQEFEGEHNKWALNTSAVRQHKFCANLCVNFLSGNQIADKEAACINSCFKKYSSAYNFFVQEKHMYMSHLNDLQLRGEDEYVARDI